MQPLPLYDNLSSGGGGGASSSGYMTIGKSNRDKAIEIAASICGYCHVDVYLDAVKKIEEFLNDDVALRSISHPIEKKKRSRKK